MPRKPTSTNPYAVAARERMRRMRERRVIAPKVKLVVESEPAPSPIPAKVADYEQWSPSDARKALAVKRRVCVGCTLADHCLVPCDRFRRAYDATG